MSMPNKSPIIGRMASPLLATLAESRSPRSTRGDAPLIGSAALISQLPEKYVASTTASERLAHFELYKRLDAHVEKNEVLMSWAPLGSGNPNVIVHAVFTDVPGSLATAASALSERNISMLRVLAFTTNAGVAIDTFEYLRREREFRSLACRQ